jgi:NADH-quinone oxidoreductase subunit H
MFPTDFFQWLPVDLLAKVLIFPGLAFASIAIMLIVWFERKFLARLMLRIGPLHVGRYAGSLQLLADFVKLLAKETVVPKKADKSTFVLMPILMSTIPALSLAVMPFSPTWIVFKLEYSLLFVLAVMSIIPPLVLLAGWASNNKYSFIGGLRAVLQFAGYEVPFAMSMVGVILLAGSLNLVDIVKAQSIHWFLCLQPLGALIFLTSALAETERLPFDVPEADQELVVGWMTEYSGAYFGLLWYGNYMRLLVVSFLFTTLFLGGWYGPPILHPIGWFLFKSAVVIVVVILIRGALPRVRIDQLLKLGWRFLIPLAIANTVWCLILLRLGVMG